MAHPRLTTPACFDNFERRKMEWGGDTPTHTCTHAPGLLHGRVGLVRTKPERFSCCLCILMLLFTARKIPRVCMCACGLSYVGGRVAKAVCVFGVVRVCGTCIYALRTINIPSYTSIYFFPSPLFRLQLRRRSLACLVGDICVCARVQQTIMTARQLLSILRLSQSLARIRFLEGVTSEEVDEVRHFLLHHIY